MKFLELAIKKLPSSEATQRMPLCSGYNAIVVPENSGVDIDGMAGALTWLLYPSSGHERLRKLGLLDLGFPFRIGAIVSFAENQVFRVMLETQSGACVLSSLGSDGGFVEVARGASSVESHLASNTAIPPFSLFWEVFKQLSSDLPSRRPYETEDTKRVKVAGEMASPASEDGAPPPSGAEFANVIRRPPASRQESSGEAAEATGANGKAPATAHEENFPRVAAPTPDAQGPGWLDLEAPAGKAAEPARSAEWLETLHPAADVGESRLPGTAPSGGDTVIMRAMHLTLDEGPMPSQSGAAEFDLKPEDEAQRIESLKEEYAAARRFEETAQKLDLIKRRLAEIAEKSAEVEQLVEKHEAVKRDLQALPPVEIPSEEFGRNLDSLSEVKAAFETELARIAQETQRIEAEIAKRRPKPLYLNPLFMGGIIMAAGCVAVASAVWSKAAFIAFGDIAGLGAALYALFKYLSILEAGDRFADHLVNVRKRKEKIESKFEQDTAEVRRAFIQSGIDDPRVFADAYRKRKNLVAVRNEIEIRIGARKAEIGYDGFAAERTALDQERAGLESMLGDGRPGASSDEIAARIRGLGVVVPGEEGKLYDGGSGVDDGKPENILGTFDDLAKSEEAGGPEQAGPPATGAPARKEETQKVKISELMAGKDAPAPERKESTQKVRIAGEEVSPIARASVPQAVCEQVFKLTGMSEDELFREMNVRLAKVSGIMASGFMKADVSPQHRLMCVLSSEPLPEGMARAELEDIAYVVMRLSLAICVSKVVQPSLVVGNVFRQDNRMGQSQVLKMASSSLQVLHLVSESGVAPFADKINVVR